MPLAEIFVPAVISKVQTIDPGEIRLVALTLHEEYEIDGHCYPVHDAIRPGNAFLARPLGARTGKMRRRMYTRSNCASTTPRVLETIINHTHEARADTSIWWQTDQVETLQQAGGTIDVRMHFDPERRHLLVSENSATCQPRNLRLEPDDEWPAMRFVAIALSTGITPFLAHLRYMKALDFGRTQHPPGCHFTLIASVRNPRQLMEHDELLELERMFPENVRYYPVLTREWPPDWPYGKGRIIRVKDGPGGEAQIDLKPLLDIVPDLQHVHLRMCGNAECRDQLQLGLRQHGVNALSFRSEVW